MAETNTPVKTNKSEEKKSPKDAVMNYLKGVKSEWGKVTWPEKNQIIGETIIVVVVVSFFTVVVYLLDIIFKYILGLIK